MNKTFITASETFCTLTERVPEYYFRKTFLLPAGAEKVSLSISGLGFYRLYLNGRELTKGLLAPYISNPNHYCYFDTYDLTPHLLPGKNALGVLLGNGFLNPWDAYVWGADRDATFRASPRLALECKGERNGKEQLTEQLSFLSFADHPVVQMIRSLDLMNLTPSGAFAALEQMKEAVKDLEKE